MHARAWLWPGISLVSLAISLGIAAGAWRRRDATGARAFAAYAFGFGLIACGALVAGALIPYVIASLPALGTGIALYQALIALGLAVGNALLALGLVRNVTERKHAAREIALAREQLHTLSRSLVRRQEEERSAMAREFHDEIGQALSCQILTLTMLQREARALPEATAGSLVAHAAESLRIAETLLDSMHRLVMRLRPSVLDHLGLIPALQQILDTSADPNLTLSLETVGLPPHARFTPDVETALYRVVQEAVTNVIRHAGARRVDVLLERPPDAARGDRLILLIEDDGAGFDPESAMRSSRLGLLGMRERVESLGGTLTLESSPGQGTTILVEVPYAQATPAHSDPDR